MIAPPIAAGIAAAEYATRLQFALANAALATVAPDDDPRGEKTDDDVTIVNDDAEEPAPAYEKTAGLAAVVDDDRTVVVPGEVGPDAKALAEGGADVTFKGAYIEADETVDLGGAR